MTTSQVDTVRTHLEPHLTRAHANISLRAEATGSCCTRRRSHVRHRSTMQKLLHGTNLGSMQVIASPTPSRLPSPPPSPSARLPRAINSASSLLTPTSIPRPPALCSVAAKSSPAAAVASPNLQASRSNSEAAGHDTKVDARLEVEMQSPGDANISPASFHLHEDLTICGTRLQSRDADTLVLETALAEQLPSALTCKASGAATSRAAASPSHTTDTIFLTADASFEPDAAAGRSGLQGATGRYTRGAGTHEFPFNHTPQPAPVPTGTARTEQTVAISQCLPCALDGLAAGERCGESAPLFATDVRIAQWQRVAPAAHLASEAAHVPPASLGHAAASTPVPGKQSSTTKVEDRSAKRIESLIAQAGAQLSNSLRLLRPCLHDRRAGLIHQHVK